MSTKQKLRIGYVPEHFSTPLHFAHSHSLSAHADLIPFPSGTGHMVTALTSPSDQPSSIDIAIGLTEGFIAGHLRLQASGTTDPGFKLVGTYVNSPLRWAISTGAGRGDVNEVKDLEGKRVGVSRIGSGSYVMSFVLAEQQGWLSSQTPSPSTSSQPQTKNEKNEQEQRAGPFPLLINNTFPHLLSSVNDKTTDFFLWEYFTTKHAYDAGHLKYVADIYTPWPSWMIAARASLLPGDSASEELSSFLAALNTGVAAFQAEPERAVRHITGSMRYSEEDARAWMASVEFCSDVRGVDSSVVNSVVRILKKAGVLGEAVEEGGREVRGVLGLER